MNKLGMASLFLISLLLNSFKVIKRIIVAAIAISVASCTSQKKDLPDVLRFNESKGIASLDPAFATTLPTIWPTVQIFNGLVQLDDSLRVVPSIAREWKKSEDQTLYTFTLRTDVRFHDDPCFAKGKGRKVVASDFVYTFNRILDEKVASPGRWVFSGIDTTFHSKGFNALNDSTLQIKLLKPSPFFTSTLAMPISYVVPKEAVEKYREDFRKHPVGTGPFMIKMWREGEMLVLVRNPHYFEKDSQGRSLPYLKAINISFITDKYSEFMEFIRGNLDFISGVNQSTKDEIITNTGKLNPKYANRIVMLESPFLNSEYLGVTENLAKDHPLMNPKVRKAIAIGFDRQKMLKHLRKNVAIAAENGIIPSSIPGYLYKETPYKYNPGLAAKLLAEAGYPNGNGIPTLTVTTTEDYVDLLEFVQHDLSLLGIKVSIDVVPGPSFRQQLASGKLPFFRGSWIADYPDPENYMALFYSKNESPNGPNYTRFRNPKFDMLYEKSFEETGTSRDASFMQMAELLSEQTPAIPLYFDKAVRFVQMGVQGLEPNPMNYLYLKKVYKRGSTTAVR